MALKNGKPYLSFAVQGGDIQDQVLLQFFLGVVEFGMNVQTPAWVRKALEQRTFTGGASDFGEDYGIAW